MNQWKYVCLVDEIPKLGSRVVRQEAGSDIALFRTASNEIFALHDRCPHKGGPLSQGIVHGKQVTCPLHAWSIDLDSGHAVAPDQGLCQKIVVKLENSKVYLSI